MGLWARIRHWFSGGATQGDRLSDVMASAPRSWDDVFQSEERGLALEYIRGGGDPRETAPDGTTPLHRAVMMGRRDIVLALIEHGADVRAGPRPDYTPLSVAQMMAVTSDSEEHKEILADIMEYLL